ncbi:uncharacterized protein At3g17950 [Tasmannia lanceolata]|uniref:uncharacterized protein At3g17950 n=1 Tax=Tasmannia lanceolata TaxID=3420 RepID=UPI004064C696
MDQGNDLLPSSPTISSLSSSDLDTESTGSFFHDRSTTLGTLMGVTFPPISVRVSSEGNNNAVTSGGNAVRRKSKKQSVERRRHNGKRWWMLCREDNKTPSLGDFLEFERRFGDGTENRFFYGVPPEIEPAPVEVNGVLFADGRVLPPRQENAQAHGGRFPVSFNGICCGGEG